MIDRRSLMAGGMALAAASTVPAWSSAPASSPFVRVRDQQLRLGDKRYPVIGTNMWYAAYLGADAPFGNRARLDRELDRLKALGVNNIRLLGASEQSPLHGAITPTFRGPGPKYDPALLGGLDWALHEIGKRGMTAVIYTNNFWEWSGGMAAYLTYTNGGKFVEAVNPRRPWTDFPDFVAGFYENPKAIALANDYLTTLVSRTNSVTGVRYAKDPTIMAWQLANEPRPAGTDAVYARTYQPYLDWLRATAELIKSIDPNHLVSTGSEGAMGCLQKAACVADTNAIPAIDYVTIHIWPRNFGWVDVKDLSGTYEAGTKNTLAYIADHVALARRLNKPVVIEEFGFPRDGAGYEPGSATILKDRYYRLLLDAVVDGVKSGGPLAGANFWAWNGEGRAQHPDHRFQPGDTAFVGDPSHEPQGMYGVFDNDSTTLSVLRDWSQAMRRVVT